MPNSEKKKKCLELWWKGAIPPNLVLICLKASEKSGFTDDGRTTDDGRPCDDSSSDVQ